MQLKDWNVNIEEAKLELDMAEREVRGCYGHLDRALTNWRDAEAARGDNDRHYRLRRIHGDDYRKKLTEVKDSALEACRRAEERLEKAKAAYGNAINS